MIDGKRRFFHFLDLGTVDPSAPMPIRNEINQDCLDGATFIHSPRLRF